MSYWNDTYVQFADLVGKTLVSVQNNDNDELVFSCTDGSVYKQYHSQDCCEKCEHRRYLW